MENVVGEGSRPAVEVESLPVIDALISVDKVVEVGIGVLDAADLIVFVDEVSGLESVSNRWGG